jgi:hypothetical protein
MCRLLNIQHHHRPSALDYSRQNAQFSTTTDDMGTFRQDYGPD